MDWGPLTIIARSEGGLNVGSQRTITGGPTVGDGDERGSGPPGPADVLLGNDAVERQSPNDIESKGICPKPRHLGNNLNHQSDRNRVKFYLREW